MRKLIKLGIAGLLISFLGTLPLGTLNITAFHIAASKTISEALWFSIAVVLIELLVVRLTLMGDRRINFNGKLSFYLLPMAIALLLYLAISSFIAYASPVDIGVGADLFPGIQSVFLLGLALSALNPMHIPFWMGWNRILRARNLLGTQRRSYAAYIAAIGLGSLGGLLVFVFSGRYIVEYYLQYSMLVNLLLGFLYLGFSLYLLFLLYKKHLKFKLNKI